MKKNFGMRIEISHEEQLLDTGGGLKKAAWFFLEHSRGLDEPFVLHNVDVISTIDLGKMVRSHRECEALATLAVKDRETSRYLLFDEQMRLCGRRAPPRSAATRLDSRGGCPHTGTLHAGTLHTGAFRTGIVGFLRHSHYFTSDLLLMTEDVGVLYRRFLFAVGCSGEKILDFVAMNIIDRI